MNDGWVLVARMDDLTEGRGRRCRVGDEQIALWLVNGTCYAIDSVCAHQHMSTLHEGIRSDLEVTCPLHGWSYSLVNGRATHGSGRVRTFPVKIERGAVYI